ncbi:hypothetical protein [Clostridium thailandense]|uniref:hypothetical protein n=1 Tax=Clostridium thailandense TaxID=2794346 RepID=UPI0039898211
MNRKKLFISGVVLLIFIFLALVKFAIFDRGFDITIRNNTDITVSGLKITYEKITKDIEVPSLSSHKKLKINVLPTENFSENSMKIYYIDNQGNKQEECIVGYFEKGYRGKVTVDINSVDKNGKLYFKVISSSNFI